MSPDARPRFVAVRPGARALGTESPGAGLRGAGLPGDRPLGAGPQEVAPSSTVEPIPLARNLPEFGELASFVSDPAVTDVFVNSAGESWVDRGQGPERRPTLPLTEPELRELAVRLIALGGRHIDEATPCVDVRLHDGIRVHAVLPPVSPLGTLLSIRLPRVRRLAVDDLAAAGFFDEVAVDGVLDLVARRANILVTGAGGSGKTTLLSALLAAAAPTDRIIAIEDVAELQVDHPHFVSLEARQPNLEGAGEIGLARLVREALRMRPDRLVLGECRGAEVRELLAALNTGHDGGAGTLHANSLEDVPARLEALGALAGLGVTAIARQAVSAIGAVLHVGREGGIRRLVAVGRFTVDAAGRLRTEALPRQRAEEAGG
ncbi:MAG TPA: TadA family conjugal transfer-associated ATPase [Terrimesophilobacter sp.]|nr:TadA family conjugal transfer-associated ATPase [Terrimesophilobacter sp.]